MKKYILIPSVLLAYLAVMSYIGYQSYVSGTISALYYFGVIGICLVIIIVLFFLIKKREQYRKERNDDIEAAQKDSEK